MDSRCGYISKNLCQNERIWTLRGRAPGTPPLDPPMKGYDDGQKEFNTKSLSCPETFGNRKKTYRGIYIQKITIGCCHWQLKAALQASMFKFQIWVHVVFVVPSGYLSLHHYIICRISYICTNFGKLHTRAQKRHHMEWGFFVHQMKITCHCVC